MHFKTSAEVEAKAREALARPQAAVPRWFGIQPKAKCTVEVMGMFAAHNVDVRADQRVVTDNSMADHAIRADVDVVANLDLGRGEHSAKTEHAIPRAPRQRRRIERPAEEIPGDTWPEAQELAVPLEQSVLHMRGNHRRQAVTADEREGQERGQRVTDLLRRSPAEHRRGCMHRQCWFSHSRKTMRLKRRWL